MKILETFLVRLDDNWLEIFHCCTNDRRHYFTRKGGDIERIEKAQYDKLIDDYREFISQTKQP